MIPTHSDRTTPSRPSSRASSGHASSAGDEISDDEDERPKKKKTSVKPVLKKSTAGANASGVSNSGGASFLTAAEQREQGKKNDKKASEDAFEFLLDIRDVNLVLIATFQSRNSYSFCRAAVKGLVSPIMTQELFLYQSMRGIALHRSKNRYDFVAIL